MALAPDIVAAIAQRLADRAGLELPAWVIDARATARIALLGCAPDAYVDRLAGDELDALLEAVRVGESRLFRHRAQLTVLEDVIAPSLSGASRGTVRVWSAGCAAGEEPYTLALVLARALPGADIEIHATDLSDDAIAQARTARFARAALQYVPDEYRDGFLDDGEDHVRVAPAIAKLVSFERANLLDGPAPRGCDLVWCRNVLIYFTADARRRAIERLVQATVPGGHIFVGYSESLRDVAALEAVRALEAVYYVKRDVDDARRRRTPTTPLFGIGVVSSGHGAISSTGGISSSISGAIGGETRRVAGRVVSEDRTPPPIVFPPEPPTDDVLVLRGRPTAAQLTAELSARLGLVGLRALAIDLDGAELLDDELAPVLRRVRAAARTAGLALELRATRTGARRWLARHALDEAAP